MKYFQLKTFYQIKYMGQFITIYLENVDDKGSLKVGNTISAKSNRNKN